MISAAKVKALMKGRFNVSYGDLNELAFPVLRHRIKMNFEAVAERVTQDDAIRMVIDELNHRKLLKARRRRRPRPIRTKRLNPPTTRADAKTGENNEERLLER